MKMPIERLTGDSSRSTPRPGRGLPLLALALLALPAWAAPTPAGYPKMAPLAKYLSADQASEIALARSAAPQSISAKATVLTLGKQGYETAVKGSNGFVCFVERSWANDFDNGQFWNPKIRTPQCWNAAAASSLLPDYLNRTRWVLAGVSTDEMTARTKAAFAKHEVGPPAPGSMAYMLSKDQYIIDTTPPGREDWYPHVMFFMAATDGSPWGANVSGGPLFSTTSDVEPVTTYFVLAPKWSDGTLGPYATGAGKSQEHHHHS
jgi:hypothetical protein